MEEQLEKQHAAAKAKKQRMMEIEAEKKKTMPPTESEMEATFKNDTLKERVHKTSLLNLTHLSSRPNIFRMKTRTKSRA